jgi:hypothetical protein
MVHIVNLCHISLIQILMWYEWVLQFDEYDICFQLVKVEGGLLDGEVIFHEYIKKTKEELAIILKRREERR